VARDEAFCFLYAENLRLLEAAGARLAFFSPLRDRALPEGTQALYLPGGYPELHAAALSANSDLRAEIRAHCLDGLPAWGECGGFMYLCAAIRDASGVAHPLCGVFGCEAVLGTKLAALGYREAVTLADSPLGPAGGVVRGHEFHYSSLAGDPGTGAVPALRVRSRRGEEPGAAGLVRANTLGAWVHLHLASNPGMARWFAGGGR
jgi:cobyrinic acid a,c-diamide synthase